MADNTSQKATKSGEKSKYPNAINRTTSESLRVGDSDKVISHPTSLSSGTANAKKKTSFQITSVTVGSRISNDGGDDSADDLDESHTDDISDVVDISRVTDIENETPSYSEDTFSKDDVFFNTSASLGSAPVIPTSSQYGLAIVANENCVNPSATCANNISSNELHVSVADNVINLVGVKHNESEMRDIHSHSGRNERFKVVKIESTEPFRRGRWMCMDYLDHSMVQQQQSQSNVTNNLAKESNDGLNVNAQHAATDSGISVSDVPPPVSTVDEQVPSNLDKGTQDHQLYTMNPSAGQTAPGGYPSVSPGQTMQSQPPSQVIQQLTQSASLNTPMQQNLLNSSQHQSLQAQQMQQVISNSGMPVQQQSVQMSQQPPQQMQSQPIQMQSHMQQQQQQQQQQPPQQTTPQQVPVSQQMPPPQQVQMQPPQPMPQMPPQQHIPQQQMHSMPIPNQQMQVPQSMMQQIPQQSIPAQMQPQPQAYPQQAPQQMQQHIQQPIHQMAPSLQPTMTQNQASPQAYQPTMQQCPPGISPQQMMTVPQHQIAPQPHYAYPNQGIPMMTPQGQQQGQIMPTQSQQGQMMTASGQQGQMMTSQGQMISMPPQVHQTSVPIQQTYSVPSIPPQQQSQPQQTQQQPQPSQPQAQQQQQQPQQQMSIGHSASMHQVPAASITTSIAGYLPSLTGQNVPNIVSQPNPAATVAVAGSSQTTPTVMQQQYIMPQQSAGHQAIYSGSMPSSVVEAITSDAGMMEQVVQTAALLGSLAEVTSASDDAPPTGEEAESASGTSAVAIDNKIEQAMDLVKSHLMFAVREEVEVLKEKIAELMDRINHLEVENTILKANASQETLAQLSNLPAPPSSNNAP